jgi:hypothetical protein
VLALCLCGGGIGGEGASAVCVSLTLRVTSGEVGRGPTGSAASRRRAEVLSAAGGWGGWGRGAIADAARRAEALLAAGGRSLMRRGSGERH